MFRPRVDRIPTRQETCLSSDIISALFVFPQPEPVRERELGHGRPKSKSNPTHPLLFFRAHFDTVSIGCAGVISR